MRGWVVRGWDGSLVGYAIFTSPTRPPNWSFQVTQLTAVAELRKHN